MLPAEPAAAGGTGRVGDEVGADDDRRRDRLGREALDGRKDGEPEPDETGEADADRRRRQPARELELLDALADHHEQDEAEKDPGQDEHPPVRQAVVDENVTGPRQA